MTDFKRRPVLAGNTDSDVLAQPHIVGSIARDVNGDFLDLGSPGELVIETESGGPTTVLLNNVDKKLTTAIDDINLLSGTHGAEAEDRDGVLLLRTLGTGEGAFIRIHPALSFEDATFVFGLPRHPDPRATVSAAEQGSSPPRPDLQGNPTGTGFIGFGEDRVGSAYNRALQLLSSNLDYLHAQLSAPIAALEVINVVDDGFWGPRLHLNADNELDQIDLSNLGLLDARYDGRRIFVGNLDNDSSLDQIAEYFAIQDRDDKELLFKDLTVRVGAVSRGLRPGSPPGFTDETSAPGTPLFDTNGVSPDGGNALGVDRTKITATITDILFRTNVRCTGALFITNGVIAGDKATITLATINLPFNHNGQYLVETVVSEEELVLKALNPGDRGELNPTDTGVFGVIEITSTGEFENGLFITLVPPLPRFPLETGGIKIVLGMESSAGSLLVDTELLHGVRTSEEVDSYVQREIQRRLTLDGIYDGQGGINGAGHYARVDSWPFLLSHSALASSAAVGVSVRSGTGEIQGGNILHVDPAFSFVAADAGRTVKLSNGPGWDEEAHIIVQILDATHALLSPQAAGRITTYDLSNGTVDWEIFDGVSVDIPAAMQIVSSVGTTRSRYGMVFDKRHETTGTEPPIPGTSMLHIERVKLNRAGDNISRFNITFTGSNEVLLPADPEDTYNIYSEANSDTKGISSIIGSLFRIHNGPYAGMYRVMNTRSDTVSPANAVDLRNMDGTIPVFAASVLVTKGSFYNIQMGTKVPFFGELDPLGLGYGVSGFHLFHDGVEGNDLAGTSPVMTMNWRGTGGGLRVRLNDTNFVAHDNDDGAGGSVIDAEYSVPAKGIRMIGTASDTGATTRRLTSAFDGRVVSNAHDLNLEGGTHTNLPGFAGRFVQGGKDPAVVIVRHNETTTISPSTPGLSIPAALVLGSKERGVGRGSAMEVKGSIYQGRGADPLLATEWDDGGIFTETAVGAGRWLYPLHSKDSEPYYGNEVPAVPFIPFEDGTRLGYPGQIEPLKANDADPSGEILAQNFIIANMPHKALLYATYFSVDNVEALSRFIGTRVRITTGTLIDDEFRIIAFVVGDSHAVVPAGEYVAVLERDSGLPVVQEAVDFKVLGQRWHKAHISIADWMLIGTESSFDQGYLPALTAGVFHNETSEKLYYSKLDEEDFDTIELVTEGLTGAAPVFPEPHGDGVGLHRVLADFPVMEGRTIGSYSGQWQTEIREPRSAFPNVGVINASEDIRGRGGNFFNPERQGPVLGPDNPGDLITDGYALEEIVRETPAGAFLGWTSVFGGSLKLGGDGVNASAPVSLLTDQVRVWKRGFRQFSAANFAIQTTLWMATPNTDFEFTLQLILDDGTVIADSGLQSLSPASPEQLTEFVYEFKASELNDKAWNYLNTNSHYDQGVHLAMLTDISNGFGLAEFNRVYIVKWSLEHSGRAARITGPLHVNGPLLTQGLRSVSPYQGFQTVTPMDVDIMRRQEYSRAVTEPPTSGFFVGGNEIEGGDLGLIWGEDDATSPKWVRPVFEESHFFRKGPYSAAIVGYHPFYDPMWYRWITDYMSDGNPEDRFIKPGKTGFMGALNPPHGSTLTSFVLNMSFTPSVQKLDGGVTPRFTNQVWHETPNNLGKTSALADWEDRSRWVDKAGVRVRIFRYNLVDFDDNAGQIGATVGLTNTAEIGYPDTLLDEIMSIDESPSGDLTTNLGIGAEDTYTFRADLRKGDLGTKNEQLVDRRHYGYLFTVEFYIGRRNIGNVVGPVLTYESASEEALYNGHLRRLTYNPLSPGGGDYNFQVLGAAIENPPDKNPLGDGVSAGHPQVVKFRGARLGWVTDKPGDGGWG